MKTVNNVREVIAKVEVLHNESKTFLTEVRRELSNPVSNLTYLLKHKSEDIVINEYIENCLNSLNYKIHDKRASYSSFPLDGAITKDEEQVYIWFAGWLDTYLSDAMAKGLDKLITSSLSPYSDASQIIFQAYAIKASLQLIGIYKGLRDILLAE